MAPIKAKLVNPTWIDLVNKCLSQRIVLSEKVVYVLSIVISSLTFLHPRSEFLLFTNMREFNLTHPIPTHGKDTNRAATGWKTGAVFANFKGRHHVMSHPSISGTSVNQL